MELYSYWRSSGTYRVRLVLAYKNISYTAIPVHLHGGQQESPEFIQKNPMKQLPFLSTPECSISQSMAIIFYIELTHPESSVFPKDALLKARAIEIAEIINSGIQPLQNLSLLRKIEEFGENKEAWAAETIHKGFKAIEHIITRTAGTFCIGEDFTIADAFLLPQVFNAERFYDVDMTEYPTIKRVSEHLKSMPELQAAHPDNQVDAPSNN